MTTTRDITFPTPLQALYRPASRSAGLAVGIALACLFAGLTTLGAYIVIPLEPVPITMQTLFVLLAGASIGRGWGSLSQWLYVGLGIAGVPLFAGGAAGLGILGGPTGGYLVGFLVAPWVVGTLLRRSDRIGWQTLAFTAGKLVILTLGVTHLALFHTHDWSQAIAVGALPFLPGGVFKVLAALSIHRSSSALIRHYRRQ